jgi:probable HAF family extracellular repeat protein
VIRHYPPPLPWINVVVDLGTLGGKESFGLAINAVGNISGVSYLSSTDPHAGVHAFRYMDGYGMIDVGAFPTSNFSWGYGIRRCDSWPQFC